MLNKDEKHVSDTNNGKEKEIFSMPDTYVIVFALVIVACILT